MQDFVKTYIQQKIAVKEMNIANKETKQKLSAIRNKYRKEYITKKEVIKCGLSEKYLLKAVEEKKIKTVIYNWVVKYDPVDVWNLID